MDSDLARAALIADREATVALLETMSTRLRSVVEAGADTSSDDEHDPEGSTLAFERGQLVAQIERSRVRIGEIDDALDRVRLDAYGRCETCGGDIAEARLEALPSARSCITCASAKGATRRW